MWPRKPSPVTSERLSTELLLRKQLDLASGGSLLLEASEVFLESGLRIMFLDDPRPRVGGSGVLVVGIPRRDRLFWADPPSGKCSEVPLDVPGLGKIRRGFARRNGQIVLQTVEPTETLVITGDGELVSRSRKPQHVWHGSYGIDESKDGTVLCSEYRSVRRDSEVAPISVWKYDDRSSEWRNILELTSGHHPQGDIRHFHTCLSDPQVTGRWYLSSGDRREHSRFWFSEDDGESWIEPELALRLSPDVAGDPGSRVLRYTSATVGNGHLTWATDDHLGIYRAATCRAVLAENGRLMVEVVGLLGRNYARNFCPINEQYSMVLTEAKSAGNAEAAELYLVDRNLAAVANLRLPNKSGSDSPVTASMGSRRFQDGRAYFPLLGAILTNQRRGFLEMRAKF